MAKGNPKPKNTWKKGQSGNPKGRPKDGESLASIFAEVLSQLDVEVRGKKISRYRAIALRLSQAGVEGNISAGIYCINRIMGMPNQPIAVSKDDDLTVYLTETPEEKKD